jgi:hypothetical protein
LTEAPGGRVLGWGRLSGCVEVGELGGSSRGLRSPVSGSRRR